MTEPKTNRIYRLLRENEGSHFSPIQIAKALDLNYKQVANGLSQLHRHKRLRGIEHDAHGAWTYREPKGQLSTLPYEVPVQVPSISVAEWREAGGEVPRSRFFADIVIHGIDHLIEARQVIVDASGVQQFVEWPADADHLSEVFCTDGHWNTIDIEGGQYALFMSPRT